MSNVKPVLLVETCAVNDDDLKALIESEAAIVIRTDHTLPTPIQMICNVEGEEAARAAHTRAVQSL